MQSGVSTGLEQGEQGGRSRPACTRSPCLADRSHLHAPPRPPMPCRPGRAPHRLPLAVSLHHSHGTPGTRHGLKPEHSPLRSRPSPRWNGLGAPPRVTYRSRVKGVGKSSFVSAAALVQQQRAVSKERTRTYIPRVLVNPDPEEYNIPSIGLQDPRHAPVPTRRSLSVPHRSRNPGPVLPVPGRSESSTPPPLCLGYPYEVLRLSTSGSIDWVWDIRDGP